MGAKRINKRSKIAWRQEISKIQEQTRKKSFSEYLKAEKHQKGLDKDTHNRNYIVTKIRQYIAEGMKKEKAVERVIEEEKEVVEEFDYLTKNGLDIRVVFSNWANNPNHKMVNEPFSNKDDER